jgi:hypothetical protein
VGQLHAYPGVVLSRAQLDTLYAISRSRSIQPPQKYAAHTSANSFISLQVNCSIGFDFQFKRIVVQLPSMLLKRKRSDSEISNSSSSILSSPPPLNLMDISSSSPSISPFLRDINTPHLSSRTRKRFRDNRPSEAKIHGEP